MQAPTHHGPPDLRLKMIHGTRIGGIKGYGIGWRIHHHQMIKHHQKASEWDRAEGGRRIGINYINPNNPMTIGRGHHRKKQRRRHGKQQRHKKKSGGSGSSAIITPGHGVAKLKHGIVKDVGAPETMWGHIGDHDRVARTRHLQVPYSRIYRNFNSHSTGKRMQIASGTPHTYINSREFEGRYLGRPYR